MRRTEEPRKAIVELVLDDVAMNEAVLEGDWPEARFRCQLVAAGAANAGLMDVGVTAALVAELLGSAGTEPRTGYGVAMDELSRQIVALRADG